MSESLKGRPLDRILAALTRDRLSVEWRGETFWFTPVTYTDRDRVDAHLRSRFGRNEDNWPRNEERAVMLVHKLETEDGEAAFTEADLPRLMGEIPAGDLDRLYVKVATSILGVAEGKGSSPDDGTSAGD